MQIRRPCSTLLRLSFLILFASCNPTQPSSAGSGSGGASGAGQGGTSSGASGGRGGSSADTSARGGAGGTSASGGRLGSGGRTGSGGSATGGDSSTGGNAGASSGGRVGSGGSTTTGGSSGGVSGKGGSSGGSGGAKATGGSSGSGGVSGGGGSAGGSSGTDCTFTIITNQLSPAMATAGIVEWSTTLAPLASAQIVYTLDNAGSGILNKGGAAPVDLKKTHYHTLLLGLKQSSSYTFHIEATSSNGQTCKSSDYALPKTGTLSGVPSVTRTVASNTSAQAVGFIVTSTGMGSGMGGGTSSANAAYILDADGAVVWAAAAPSQCSRARMDYEGVNMWMLSLNVQNTGGEARFLSMDGQTGQTKISGLSSAHHDFAVLPGKIATMVWTTTGTDPESNLVEHADDGSGDSTTAFKIGSNLYAGGQSAFGGSGNTYHCNSILYHQEDDTYTIGDRNPNLYVKVKHDGTPVWQIGGSCTGAKAPKCAAGAWMVNHGHDFDHKSGNLLIFNNGSSGSAHVLELGLTETASAISYTQVKDFSSGVSSNVLGDVQRLPNGNTLVTYTTSGQMIEVDPSWNTVQTLKGSFGYADWRETLYGPPGR